jgi:hypothetical protein
MHSKRGRISLYGYVLTSQHNYSYNAINIFTKLEIIVISRGFKIYPSSLAGKEFSRGAL